MPFFFVVVYILIEIALFVWLGERLGVLGVLAEVIASFVLGIYLIQVMADRSRSIVLDLQAGIQTRQTNPKFYLLVSGVLLMIPGFFTDALALLLFIPPVRQALWAKMGVRVATNIDGRGSPHQNGRRTDNVIEGEIIDRDDK